MIMWTPSWRESANDAARLKIARGYSSIIYSHIYSIRYDNNTETEVEGGGPDPYI